VESGARNIDFILRKSLTPRLSDVLLGAIADQRPLAGLHVAVDASGEWLISRILANESGASDLAAEPLEELV
jgi:type VI secretion system protein VasG